MTLDASHVAALTKREAYSLMVQSYENEPVKYPLLCEVIDLNSRPELLYGDKGDVLEGTDGFKEREDNEEIQADIPGPGYTWYCKTRQFSRKLGIAKRLAEQLVANGRLPGYIAEQTRNWGQDAAVEKDDFLAGMYQKGTLTAGSTAYFGNSFVGQVDPNFGFIYDGLPWFDTAHTLTGSSGTYANHIASADLSPATLEAALIAMRTTNAVTERGQRRIIRPDTLIVPPGLSRTAMKLLESELEPGTTTNDINVHRGRLNLVVWDALTDDADAWWVSAAKKGKRFYDSGMPMIESWYDEHTKTFWVSAECHYGATVTDWRYDHANNKAAS